MNESTKLALGSEAIAVASEPDYTCRQVGNKYIVLASSLTAVEAHAATRQQKRHQPQAISRAES